MDIIHKVDCTCSPTGIGEVFEPRSLRNFIDTFIAACLRIKQLRNRVAALGQYRFQIEVIQAPQKQLGCSYGTFCTTTRHRSTWNGLKSKDDNPKELLLTMPYACDDTFSRLLEVANGAGLNVSPFDIIWGPDDTESCDIGQDQPQLLLMWEEYAVVCSRDALH
ncbi:unnamed protein product [Calypogeia fissa]